MLLSCTGNETLRHGEPIVDGPTTLSSRPERTRISCHAALDKAACAPFRKEGRMMCTNATMFHRKSGVAEWRDLRCAPRPSRILRGVLAISSRSLNLDKSVVLMDLQNFVIATAPLHL